MGGEPRLPRARGRGLARPAGPRLGGQPPRCRLLRRRGRRPRHGRSWPSTTSPSPPWRTTRTTCTPTSRCARRPTSTCAAASTRPPCSGAGWSAPSSGATSTRTVRENMRLAEKVMPPLVEYAAARDVRLVVENCPMEGWHPDGYPANLAYSPELWDWLTSLGLFLNFDPSHLVWLGIDPVPALDRTPRPGPARPGQGHRARPRLAQPVQRLRPGGRQAVALGQRLVALPDTGAGRGRLATHRRRAVPGRLRRRRLGGARGPGVGWHSREGPAGTGHRRAHTGTPDRGLTRTALPTRTEPNRKGLPMERGVYFDAWFPRQHCYHPSLPPRRLRMVDDLVDYRATVLVWSALGGGSLSLPYLEQEAFGPVDARSRFYGFVNDSEFIAACQERGIKVIGIVFEAQGWEFPVELNDAEDAVLALNELRGVGHRDWLGLREFSANRYPQLWEPVEQVLPRRSGQQRRRARHRPDRGVRRPRHPPGALPRPLGGVPRPRAPVLLHGPQQPGLARVPQGRDPDPGRRRSRRHPARRGRAADGCLPVRRVLLQGLHEGLPRPSAGAGQPALPADLDGMDLARLPLRRVAARARLRLQDGPRVDAPVR